MSDCLFCKIARHEIPAKVIYEDDYIMAFLDICPIRAGHTQIIPKKHFETFEVMPFDIAAKITEIAQKLGIAMKDIYGVSRVAFLFTGGDVPHAHAHLVPMHSYTDITSQRYILNEDVSFGSDHLKADEDSLNKETHKIKDALVKLIN